MQLLGMETIPPGARGAVLQDSFPLGNAKGIDLSFLQWAADWWQWV